MKGLEPPAPWSQTKCATKLRYTSIKNWRRRRDSNPRTGLIQPNPLAGDPLEPLEYFSILVIIQFNMAERVGFEPTVPLSITGFQDQLLKPLGHLSVYFAFMLYLSSTKLIINLAGDAGLEPTHA